MGKIKSLYGSSRCLDLMNVREWEAYSCVCLLPADWVTHKQYTVINAPETAALVQVLRQQYVMCCSHADAEP